MKNKGFLTIAQNNKSTDYIKLAYALAMSLKASQSAISNLSIAVTKKSDVPEKYAWAFDEIIEIPWGDAASKSEWKLENEWKLYHITPYRETIKLDCDMLFLNDINAWWNVLEKRDICIPTKVYNMQNTLVDNDFYRDGYFENKIPKLHTAFMYFKKCELAHEFFTMAEIITQNWQKFYWNFLPIKSPKEFSTDTTFSLAAKLIDRVDDIVSPWDEIPTFIHAKTKLTDWGNYHASEDWSNYVPFYFTPKLECFIGYYRQNKPLHYHLKHLITDEIISFYENKVKANGRI